MAIAAAILLVNLIYFRPWSLNLFYEKVFAEAVFSEPELLSSLGLVEQFGITSHNGKLSDESPAHQQTGDRSLEERSRTTARISAGSTIGFAKTFHPCARLVPGTARSKARDGSFTIIRSISSSACRTSSRRSWPTPIGCWPSADCEYYVMRLDALPKKFDQLLESLKVREQKQIMPPRFVVEEVLKEMTDFVAKPAAENILATSFKTRAAKIDKLTEQERADFQKRVEASITSQVYPAYQKLIDYFKGIEPKTTTDDGVWKLPDGDAFYAYALHDNTTTTLKPRRSPRAWSARSGADRGRDARDSRCQRICRPADRRSDGQARQRSALSIFER